MLSQESQEITPIDPKRFCALGDIPLKLCQDRNQLLSLPILNQSSFPLKESFFHLLNNNFVFSKQQEEASVGDLTHINDFLKRNLNLVVDSDGVLLVKGIEKWILNLQLNQYLFEEGLLRMKDVETGAMFLIRRVKEQ